MGRERGGFLEALQSLPEPTKKKIMIVATVITMVLVIYFWLAYFNNLIAGSASSVAGVDNGAVSQGAAPASQAAQPTGSLPGFFGELKGVVLNFVHGLSSIFESPQQYIVQPQR